MTRELETTVAPVADAFDALRVDYYLAGSVISSLYGIARATADIDVVARLRSDHAHALVESLSDAYYIDEDTVVDAIRRGSMFNVIHLGTMLKVDVYVVATEFDRSALSRRRRDSLVPEDPSREFSIASAEDVLLHKLRWFRDGGEVSDRQWSDILGVVRVQRASLDLDHIRRWAAELGVTDLFERAWISAAEAR